MGGQRRVVLHMGAVPAYWRDAPWDMARPGWYLTREFGPPTWTPAVVPVPLGTHMAITPLWLPIAVVAVPLLFAWGRSRRHAAVGHCRRCGYNLTGNVSGRCPECGMVPAKPARRRGRMHPASRGRQVPPLPEVRCSRLRSWRRCSHGRSNPRPRRPLGCRRALELSRRVEYRRLARRRRHDSRGRHVVRGGPIQAATDPARATAAAAGTI